MADTRITPEVGAVMSPCEELFSRTVTNEGLTTLDREILQYYVDELQKHLQELRDRRILASVLQESTPDADASE